jgi:hypothetical protein
MTRTGPVGGGGCITPLDVEGGQEQILGYPSSHSDDK